MRQRTRRRWRCAGALAALVLIATPARADEPEGPLEQLESADAEVRAKAATRLAAGETDPFLAVVALTRALDDPIPAVRRAAAASLGRLGPQACAALADLDARTADEDWSVRYAAARSLVLLGEGPDASLVEWLFAGPRGATMDGGGAEARGAGE